MAELPAPNAESDRGFEEQLRAARPRLSSGWARATEDRLLESLRRRRRQHRMALATAGLASTLVAAALAGAGPLANGGGTPAQADQGCRTVYTTSVREVGQIVKRRSGEVVVESARRPVARAVKHCR